MTHSRLAGEKCRARCMDGSATVTMVASSTTISCAAEMTARAAGRRGELSASPSVWAGERPGSMRSALSAVWGRHGRTGQSTRDLVAGSRLWRVPCSGICRLEEAGGENDVDDVGDRVGARPVALQLARERDPADRLGSRLEDPRQAGAV